MFETKVLHLYYSMSAPGQFYENRCYSFCENIAKKFKKKKKSILKSDT